MAKDDQKPRGSDLERGNNPDNPVIQLQETAERLRMAECAAKGGEYRNGQCHG
jgi:hypothetical protein